MELPLNDPGLNRYLRVYNYYRELIRTGKLKPGAKLPSIRKCAVQLQLSRTTVESAYLLLAAEGYIISRPQSGYYVTDFVDSKSAQMWKTGEAEKKRVDIRYDFASSNVDPDSFQFDLWRRYVKSALRRDERLLSYGEPQGEWELREALSNYLSRRRNVICTPEHIVVGAGVQSLLHILCPMVRERRNVYFYNAGFRQGRTIFEDYEFNTLLAGSKKYLDSTDSHGHIKGGIIYLTPSQMTAWGDVMHIRERMQLLKYAAEHDILLIEDDYNSEFRYYSRPTPSLQGLSGGRSVVYLGTFSKLLLPSIRMSFMVLPPELLPVYRKRGLYYNQTASKSEQIALCQFIRDGHLESQLRKARKLYASKAKKLCEDIAAIFGDRAAPHLGEAGFLVLAEFRTELTSEEITKKAARAGIAVRAVGYEEGNVASYPRILLSCATVGTDYYEEALKELYRIIFDS